MAIVHQKAAVIYQRQTYRVRTMNNADGFSLEKTPPVKWKLAEEEGERRMERKSECGCNKSDDSFVFVFLFLIQLVRPQQKCLISR